MKIKMKRLNNFIKNSIQGRLLVYTLMLSIAPLVVLSILVSYINYNELKGTTVDFALQSVELIFDNLEAAFDKTENIGDGILENPDIQGLMRKEYQSTTDRYSADLEGGMELSLMSLNRPEIMGMYVIGDNLAQFKSNIYSFKRESFIERDWYNQIVRSNKPIWFFSDQRSMVVDSREKRVISMGRPFIDKLTGEIKGVIVIDISTDVIDEFVDRDLGGLKGFMLLDEHNQMLSASENIMNEKDLQTDVLKELNVRKFPHISSTDLIPFQTDKAIVLYKESKITGWKLVGIIPRREIREATNIIIIVGFVISILFIGFNIMTSYHMSRRFTTPIVEMEEKMKCVQEGDFSVSIEPVGNDEFTRLAINFNQMIKEITDLINVIHEKQEQTHKLEFRALQAQINPHFLYNSLDSIIWLLRMEEVDKAIVMLKNLTILFRISLSKGSDIIPLSKELRHIDSYMTIQSLRYSKKFDYTIHVPEVIDEYKTIKLVLQPLVENAIYHGISEQKLFIHIDIIVKELDNHILMAVKDNGIGMSEDNLEKLRESISSDILEVSHDDDHDGGYGLNNINSRIKLYFGEEYGLVVDSIEGEGTTVSMLIPKNF